MNEFLRKGIDEFNRQEFYACHDTLEEIWMNSIEPDKKFYQGILQISVGCYHLSNGNWKGAVILLGEGLRKLGEYKPDYQNVDVTKLCRCSYELLITLQQINPDEVKEFYLKLVNHQLENKLTLPHIETLMENQE
jgi:predicted metal-dependent hydrolase